MTQARSWRERNAWIAGRLVEETGRSVEAWNKEISAKNFADEAALRSWLTERGVAGYPQMMLVMERFGYPDFLLASADELIDNPYADREQLRPILDAVLALAAGIGQVSVQVRKGYVTLVSPRRTFASIEPTTKSRVDLGLRLPGQRPSGRLESARSLGNSAVTARIGLSSPADVDDEVAGWLKQAYDRNI